MDEPNRKSLAQALILGFVPSLMFLIFLTMTALDLDQQIPEAIRRVSYFLFAWLSAACCFAAAWLLFKRKSHWTILLGVFLLMLNVLISLTFGWGVVLE